LLRSVGAGCAILNTQPAQSIFLAARKVRGQWPRGPVFESSEQIDEPFGHALAWRVRLHSLRDCLFQKRVRRSMNFGFFSLPPGPLILFASVAAALVAGRFAGKGAAANVDQSIFNALIVGLVAARLVFVGRYLPGYEGSVLKMLDFRDRGFDLVAGAIAGACVIAWIVLRRRALRKPLLVAVTAGVATWSVASAAAQFAQPPQIVPQVSVVDLVPALPGRNACARAGAGR
jgi:hypothetical protein